MDGRLPDFRQARFNSGRKSVSLAGNGRLIDIRFGRYFLDKALLGGYERQVARFCVNGRRLPGERS